MGARPSSYRKAGGFLNGVDGTIKGYRWTDEFNGVAFKPGKKADGTAKFHSLQFELAARLDGADEDITQNLFGGGYDDYEVSEDGLTLTAVDGGPATIGANTAVAKFVSSLVTAGFPEELLSDDPDSINLEPIIGTRVRFVQAVELDKDGKAKKRKATKGKFAGQTFDQTTTVVDQVYDLPTVAGKANGKTAKPVAKGKAAPVVDVDDLAAEVLVSLLQKESPLAKSKISMKVLKALMGDPNREAVRALLNKDEFLATEDLGWTYDQKAQTIELISE